MIDGITTYGSDELINQIKYAEPVFICMIGTTETSKYLEYPELEQPPN